MDVHNCPGCIAATMERSDTRSTQSPRKESWLRLCAKSPKVELRVLRCEQQLMEKPGALTACSPAPRRNLAEASETRPKHPQPGYPIRSVSVVELSMYLCVYRVHPDLFSLYVFSHHIFLLAGAPRPSLSVCLTLCLSMCASTKKHAYMRTYVQQTDRTDRTERQVDRPTNGRTEG